MEIAVTREEIKGFIDDHAMGLYDLSPLEKNGKKYSGLSVITIRLSGDKPCLALDFCGKKDIPAFEAAIEALPEENPIKTAMRRFSVTKEANGPNFQH